MLQQQLSKDAVVSLPVIALLFWLTDKPAAQAADKPAAQTLDTLYGLRLAAPGVVAAIVPAGQGGVS